MRRWHRWLSVFFGVLILFIASTGILSQVGALVNDARQEAAPPPAVPADFVCPETMNCRPKPQPGGWNVGLLHHLHSGEEFGPLGVVLSLMSGFALLFFAFSGLWMYIQMFRKRAGKSSAKGRFFW
ncbi:hypothetical protein GCM10022280_27400 [Sphingomonas swuensis]|uniref:PepSY domain-containing protein n=1 Tax=Sphingomonas swuensis TaxID=977800 RepID=A0ABP7TF48_9SPHN